MSEFAVDPIAIANPHTNHFSSPSNTTSAMLCKDDIHPELKLGGTHVDDFEREFWILLKQDNHAQRAAIWKIHLGFTLATGESY